MFTFGEGTEIRIKQKHSTVNKHVFLIRKLYFIPKTADFSVYLIKGNQANGFNR